MSGSDAIRAAIAAKRGERKERTLTAKEAKRLSKLEQICDQLKRKENVQNRTLQTWLTAGEYAAIEADWNEQKEVRAEIKDKPATLTGYEALLKKATFSHNRAEAFSNRGNSQPASKLFNIAEAQFERALEYLCEHIALDPNLKLWIDRDVDMSPDSNISLSPVGMPRVITSRSLDKEVGGLETAKMTKIEVKLSVVEKAIDRLKFYDG